MSLDGDATDAKTEVINTLIRVRLLHLGAKFKLLFAFSLELCLYFGIRRETQDGKLRTVLTPNSRTTRIRINRRSYTYVMYVMC